MQKLITMGPCCPLVKVLQDIWLLGRGLGRLDDSGDTVCGFFFAGDSISRFLWKTAKLKIRENKTMKKIRQKYKFSWKKRLAPNIPNWGNAKPSIRFTAQCVQYKDELAWVLTE